MISLELLTLLCKEDKSSCLSQCYFKGQHLDLDLEVSEKFFLYGYGTVNMSVNMKGKCNISFIYHQWQYEICWSLQTNTACFSVNLL